MFPSWSKIHSELFNNTQNKKIIWAAAARRCLYGQAFWLALFSADLQECGKWQRKLKRSSLELLSRVCGSGVKKVSPLRAFATACPKHSAAGQGSRPRLVKQAVAAAVDLQAASGSYRRKQGRNQLHGCWGSERDLAAPTIAVRVGQELGRLVYAAPPFYVQYFRGWSSCANQNRISSFPQFS